MAFFILTKYTLQSLRKKRFITTTKPEKHQTIHATIISKFMVHCLCDLIQFLHEPYIN